MLQSTMIGFAALQIKDHPDPLQTRRIATEWFRHLPALDVIGRQEHVVRAFDGMRQACTVADLNRIAAIQYLDATLEVDHRRLVKWYLENVRGNAPLAERFWQAANDVNRGFICAYHAALEGALAHARDRRWQSLLPTVIVRLIHFQSIDAKMRLFHNERWIPARWAQLHQLFLRATELCVERVPAALESTDPLAPRWSAEQEYIHVLLLHRLDTGNLAPAELDWASNQLRTWCRELSLEATPATPDGFYVDLSGTSGLARRTGHDKGAKVGYLDTAPLVTRIDEAIAALAEPGGGGAYPLNAQRIAALTKIRPAVAPRRHADLRRHPRVPVDVPVTISVGLARITADLALKASDDGSDRGEATQSEPRGRLGADPSATRAARQPDRTSGLEAATPVLKGGNGADPRGRVMQAARVEAITRSVAAAAEGVEEIEIQPLAFDGASDDEADTPPVAPQPESPPAAMADDALCRVKDRSIAGWRLTAPQGTSNGVSLGALIAVRPADAGDWTLGVVRRLHKGKNEELEAGMSLIAERAVPVTLRARRAVAEDFGFDVDGVDTAAMGARFAGLYVMPPSATDARLSLRSVIIPTCEHFEGRSLFLSTPRSSYAVTLRHVVDQHADWSWVAIQVSGRAQRLAS
jgi:hypothetical protein